MQSCQNCSMCVPGIKAYNKSTFVFPEDYECCFDDLCFPDRGDRCSNHTSVSMTPYHDVPSFFRPTRDYDPYDGAYVVPSFSGFFGE